MRAPPLRSPHTGKPCRRSDRHERRGPWTGRTHHQCGGAAGGAAHAQWALRMPGPVNGGPPGAGRAAATPHRCSTAAMPHRVWACRRQAAHCASCCAAASTPRLGLQTSGRSLRQLLRGCQHATLGPAAGGAAVGRSVPASQAVRRKRARLRHSLERRRLPGSCPVSRQVHVDQPRLVPAAHGRRPSPDPGGRWVLGATPCPSARCSGSRSGALAAGVLLRQQEWWRPGMGGGGGWPAFDDQHPHPAATASRHVSPASPSGPACVLCSVQLLHPGCCTVDVRSPARRRARAQQHLGRRAADTSRRS